MVGQDGGRAQVATVPRQVERRAGGNGRSKHSRAPPGSATGITTAFGRPFLGRALSRHPRTAAVSAPVSSTARGAPMPPGRPARRAAAACARPRGPGWCRRPSWTIPRHRRLRCRQPEPRVVDEHREPDRGDACPPRAGEPECHRPRLVQPWRDRRFEHAWSVSPARCCQPTSRCQRVTAMRRSWARAAQRGATSGARHRSGPCERAASGRWSLVRLARLRRGYTSVTTSEAGGQA